MNNRSIILSEYGHFNLHPQLLANLKIPLNSIILRTDNSLINLFNIYGNTIAQNCYLKIQNDCIVNTYYKFGFNHETPGHADLYKTEVRELARYLGIPQEIIDQFGTMPDYKLAEIAGCSKPVIARRRKILGIKSYAEQTGNNGKIKKGDPHRRWEKG
mgnify:CR=1 FL=1